MTKNGNIEDGVPEPLPDVEIDIGGDSPPDMATGEETDLEGLEGDLVFYRIRFRREGQEFTAVSQIAGLPRDEVVMVRTDHGLEPSVVVSGAPACRNSGCKRQASWVIGRQATTEESQRYQTVVAQEEHAFATCDGLIGKHSLEMSLVRVERFFNGSKMIFFFTADIGFIYLN